jgi:hypothetical protein
VRPITVNAIMNFFHLPFTYINGSWLGTGIYPLHRSTNGIIQSSSPMSGWAKRKKLTITGSSDGALTDYPICIAVHNAAGVDSAQDVYVSNQMLSGGEDVRFTKADGTTLLKQFRSHYATYVAGAIGTDACTGGTITASAENPPNETKDKAFDDNFTTTKWLVLGTSAWICYQFATAKTIQGYTITAGNDSPARDPKNWTFEGSNNGVDWTVLHTVTNHVSPARLATETFGPLTITGSYIYYRLNISAVQSGSILQVEEIQMSESLTISVVAVYFVKVDSIPANPGTVDIYMYYKNPAAALVSSGPDVFTSFYPGDDLTGFTFISPLSGGGNASAAVNGSKIRITATAANGDGQLFRDNQTGVNTYRVGVTIQAQDGLVTSNNQNGLVHKTTQVNTDAGHGRWLDDADSFRIADEAGGSDASAADTSHDASKEHSFVLARTPSLSKLFIDGTLRVTHNKNTWSPQYIGLHFHHQTNGKYCDYSNIFIAKYTANEPVLSTWGIEETN